VERRLASEPDLRPQLEQLRAAEQATRSVIERLDALEPAPGSMAPALRQVGRNIRSWQHQRIAGAARPRTTPATLRFPWWSYPLAAAAAITFAFLAWWYNLGDDSLRPYAQVQPPPEMRSAPATTNNSDDNRIMIALTNPRDLSDLESELQAVSELGDWMQ
jgi:hypothetical protein